MDNPRESPHPVHGPGASRLAPLECNEERAERGRGSILRIHRFVILSRVPFLSLSLSRIGMFAPQYMRWGGNGNGLGRRLAMPRLYLKPRRACQSSTRVGRT